MSKDSSRTITITYPWMSIPWFTLWIFTIAFAHLSFGQGVLGILIWPYYLGDVVATLLRVR